MSDPRTTPEDRARAAVEQLCDDPQVWATHGLPTEAKMARIEQTIAEAIRAALQERTDA